MGRGSGLFPCKLGGGWGSAGTPTGHSQSDSSPQRHSGHQTPGPLHPVYVGGILQGPQEASPYQCVQEFQPATGCSAIADGEGSSHRGGPGPQVLADSPQGQAQSLTCPCKPLDGTEPD